MGYRSSAFRALTMHNALPKIIRVYPVGGHKLDIAFADGARGVFDMDWIFERIGPMNEPLRDESYFARVFLENGALTWPNGFDLSPWNIRRRMEEAGVIAVSGVAAE